MKFSLLCLKWEHISHQYDITYKSFSVTKKEKNLLNTCYLYLDYQHYLIYTQTWGSLTPQFSIPALVNQNIHFNKVFATFMHILRNTAVRFDGNKSPQKWKKCVKFYLWIVYHRVSNQVQNRKTREMWECHLPHCRIKCKQQ